MTEVLVGLTARTRTFAPRAATVFTVPRDPVIRPAIRLFTNTW